MHKIPDLIPPAPIQPLLLCAPEPPVRRYTSVVDVTALYTGAILNDLNEVLCRTEKQKCVAAVITRESSALVFVSLGAWMAVGGA